MSSTHVYVKDWKFTELNGSKEYHTTDCFTFEPNHIIINGWECIAMDYTGIECRASWDYSDGRHTIALSIYPNGFFITVLNGKIIKKGKIKPNNTGELNMELVLSGGYIDDRFVSVRDARFSRFLKNYGINAVKHKDPNGLYKLQEADVGYRGNRCDRLRISKGGKQDVKLVDSSEGYYWYEDTVTDARWVIHTQKDDRGYVYRTLITKEDIYSLKDELSFLKN